MPLSPPPPWHARPLDQTGCGYGSAPVGHRPTPALATAQQAVPAQDQQTFSQTRNPRTSSRWLCTKRGTLTQIGKSLHRIRESRYTETTDTDQTHAAEQGEPHPLHYREELPPDCPPESATEITEATTRYRLLRNSIPEENDFDSYARQRGSPNPRLRRTPCEQHGVSLMTSLALSS